MPTTPPDMPAKVKTIPYPGGSLFRKGALSIGSRLTVCFLLIVGSIIAADAVVFWQFKEMVTPTRHLSTGDRTALALLRLQLDVDRFRENVVTLESSHDVRQFSAEAAGIRQSFLRDVENAQQELSRAPDIAREDPAIPAALKVLEVTLPSQLDTAVQLADVEDWAAVRLRLKTQIQQLIELSSALVANVDRQAQKQRAKAIQDTQTAQQRLLVVVLAAGLLMLLVAVVLGWYVTHSITVPLAELASGAHTLARGDFSHQVRVHGDDELAVVGKAFNHAARQLQELYEELLEQASLLSLTHDSIYVSDMKGVIRYWNRGAEELYGWRTEDAVGKVARELLKTVPPLPFEQIGAELLRTGRWEGELVKTKKDGTQLVVASRWSLKRDNRGAPVSILVTSNDITERKQAEENLRRSGTYLAEAQKLSHTGSWAFDIASDRYVYVSEECLRIFGFDPQESLPTREAVFRRIHPDDSESVNRGFEKSVHEKVDSSDEFRIVLPDGGVNTVHVIRHPVLNNAGDVVSLFGTAVDVTERKRAEEALRRSEAYLAEAQRLTHTGSYAYDGRTDRFLYWSEEHYRIWGFDPQQGPPDGRTLLQRVHPDDRAMVLERSMKSLRERSDYTAEYRIVLPDGTMKYIEAIGHNVSTPRQGRIEVIGTHVDITERKRAEEAVRQSEKQLREVIETIPAIAWTSSADGSIEFVNKRWQEYTGMSVEEAVGFGWKGALHPKDLDRYVERRRASLASGTPFEDEVRIRCGGTGEYRWFISRAVPLRDERGNIIRWYGTATDIHDRKRAEERLQVENIVLREEIDKASMFEEVVGASPALQTVLSAVSKVAPTDSTVLLTGQTGTGKELIARAIHRKSERSARAFISVNCAAIPQSLIASELFGHEKGAFTGALQRHLGKFELAEGGTIFLDEIGELPMETQVALLRVLQEREIQRVGGTQPIRVNVRILAATNRDLQKAIAAGTFREDLFYRFNVFPIHIPPLRERKEDIPMLVEYFIDRFARKAGKNIRSIDRQSLELLESYSWPGNIRELQNVVERSVVLCDTDMLSIEKSWLSLGNSESHVPAGSLANKIHEQEREFIEKALAEAEGKVSGPLGAAAKLGISPSALEYKIRLLKINKHQFKKYLRES